jgi:ribosomal protein S6
VRFYETTVLLDPKIGEEEIEKNLKKIETLITSLGGEMIDVGRKGLQKLGYTIKRNREAYYTFFKHNSPPNTLVRLKEQLKLNEAILRFGVILADREKARPRIVKNEEAEA